MPRTVVDLSGPEEQIRLSAKFGVPKLPSTKPLVTKSKAPEVKLTEEQIEICTTAYKEFVINNDKWPIQKFTQFFEQTKLMEEGVSLPEAVVLTYPQLPNIRIKSLAANGNVQHTGFSLT